jgi:beta-glucosidase
MAQSPAVQENKSASLPAYRNAALPVQQRVADLLARMTLPEKIAQVRSMHFGRPVIDDAMQANAFKMDSMFRYGMGMMNPDFKATAAQTIHRRNALQQWLHKNTRLGIPVIFLDEAHHGLLAPGADAFPHSIGFGCSWDTALIEKVYGYISRECRSKGTDLVLAPIVDVCRDPRWGRTGETFGEDPYLCGVLGSAVVKGFQGSSNGRVMPGHVGACLKTFTGHGGSEGANNQAPANVSIRDLREIHMESFRLSINRSKPTALMASYCEVDDIPSHASKWLLTGVLRNEWKFNGVVVSDWFAIDQLWQKHGVAADTRSAALLAFNAGVTVDLPYGVNYSTLEQQVKEGTLPVKDLDSAVALVLRLKFNLGLFEQDTASLQQAEQLMATGEGAKLALEAAEKSMVLLKNENNFLPIRKDQYKKIAVIGPCAAVNYLGDYSGIPRHNVSLLQGLRNKVGDRCEILYAPGVQLTTNGDTISHNNYQYIDTAQFPAPQANRRLIAEAVAIAKQADFIIVAVGENEQLGREAWANHPGDETDLNLQSQQDELVQAIMATGKPAMVYLAHGRPLAINWIAQNVPAIIDGWFTGEEAGNAFANILFGDVNPSGKLTISYPRSAGQVPVYYNHKPSAQFFPYLRESNLPLYPFGYGLSYTTFRYSAPKVSSPVMKKDSSVTVTVDVTNTGRRAGDEIVQLYVHKKIATVTRPVKELKDFARISLQPGETKTVAFKLDRSKIAYWNKDMQYGVEPGTVEVMTGPGSTEVQKVNVNVE